MADPARSLALLWRTSEPPSRARGGGSALTVDAIVDTAIALADAEGIDGLTMRHIAERLDAAPMSLYTYVPGKAELLDLMLDRVYAETARPPIEAPARGGASGRGSLEGLSPGASTSHGDTLAGPDDPAGPGTSAWRPALESIARENHALYLRHPWLLQVATGRPVLGPNLIAKYDYELGALDGLGLGDVDMDSVLSMVLSFVHGAAREAVEAARVVRQSGLSEQQWWDANAPYLARIFDPAQHPLAARVGGAAGEAHGAAHDPAYAFEFGLARVLDGVGAFLEGSTR